jgi:lipoate-protein ligase A
VERSEDRGPFVVDQRSSPCGAAEQLSVEQEIFDSLPKVSQRLRIWQPLPALIATTAEARLPTFAAAVARAEDRGLPVHVRRSGGGAVCLGPGMLVVTHLYTSLQNDIDGSYREFARSLMRAISTLGVSLVDAHVSRAYCDGRFDLAWRGLKVGGVAQRRRMLAGMTRVWIHAVLAVERESLRYPEAVAEFYADVGSSRVADPRSTTSLSECLPPRASAADLLLRCGAAIAGAFGTPADAGALL